MAMSDLGIVQALVSRDISIVLEAYRQFRFETDGERPMRNVAYYIEAERWLKEQGCDIDLWRQTGEEGIIWENESRKVEFFLKYVK
jgi:hypothetical protein